MDLRKAADKLAEKGRYGDDRIIHVSQAEIDGLASLVPGGRLPTNPETGLPEAFFFLPFLAGLGAAAAPAAAAALPAAATIGATAAGTGLAAGLGTGAAAAGLGSLATPLATGALGAAGTGAAGTLAGAGGAAAGGLGSLGAATGAGALGAGSLATPLTSGLGTGALTSGAGASALPAIAAPTSLGGIPLSGAGAAGAGAAAPVTTGAGGAAAAGTAAANPLTAGGVAGAGSLATPLATGVEAASATGGGGGLGGLLGGMDMGKMLQYGSLAAMMIPKGGGGSGDDKDSGGGKKGKSYERGEMEAPEDGGSSGGVEDEWNYFPNARYYNNGGLVKGYAEGGLTALSEPPAPEAGGIASAGGGVDDQQLVQATVAAIQGQIPDAEPILKAFVDTFGQAALRDLISKVQGGGAQGDGMSDSIPAQVTGAGGSEPAALSEGEYVVPADVVSGMGNGSTQAGAEQLQGMVDRTRQMKNGGMVQPPAINPRSVMPV